jgi:hypothetical protein
VPSQPSFDESVIRRLRHQDVSWQEVDDEAVVLDLASSSYFQANPTGKILLAMLVDGATASAMADALCAEFDIARDAALEDVRDFLIHLDDHGLLDPES